MVKIYPLNRYILSRMNYRICLVPRRYSVHMLPHWISKITPSLISSCSSSPSQRTLWTDCLKGVSWCQCPDLKSKFHFTTSYRQTETSTLNGIDRFPLITASHNPKPLLINKSLMTMTSRRNIWKRVYCLSPWMDWRNYLSKALWKISMVAPRMSKPKIW